MANLVSPLSNEQTRQIEELAGYGASEEDIAAELRIPLNYLKEHHCDDLAYGNAKGRNAVLKNLYEQVQSGTNVTTISLWVRSRCGWRDTGSANAPSSLPVNVNIITRNADPCLPNQET